MRSYGQQAVCTPGICFGLLRVDCYLLPVQRRNGAGISIPRQTPPDDFVKTPGNNQIHGHFLFSIFPAQDKEETQAKIVTITSAETSLKLNLKLTRKMSTKYKYLTGRSSSSSSTSSCSTPRAEPFADNQVHDFMTNGFLRLSKAFSPEKAAEWTKDVWTRLGMDPNDQSTWDKEWINMPCTWC